MKRRARFAAALAIAAALLFAATPAGGAPVPSDSGSAGTAGGMSTSAGPGVASSAGPGSSTSAPPGAGTEPPVAPVTVTLNSMTPRVPEPDPSTKKVTLTATITNTGDISYSDFTVGLERGAPITRQDTVGANIGLDEVIAAPVVTNELPSSNDQDKRMPLPAHSSVTVTYNTQPISQFMCLCATAIYPYALVVRASAQSGDAFVEVGRTQLLVPSFLQPPKPVSVSWIWPLIDRPHRSLDESVFSDDDLAKSVAPGGRLDRALTVAEQVAAGGIRMTVVTDPELLDSLAVMAGPKGYQYHAGNAVLHGSGSFAARNWLGRIAALSSGADMVLTPYADPDVNAATRAGLTYSTALDPQVQSRIGAAIAGFGNNPNRLSWPAAGALTSKALDATISSGASAVVLSDSALPGQNRTDPRPDAISPLPSAAGQALALVTDTGIEQTIGRIFKPGAVPANDQQTLLSQLAIRAVAQPDTGHYVVLTPPDRYVDVRPGVALATIRATTVSAWSVPVAIPAALTTVHPVDRGPLQTSAESAASEVDPAQMAAVLRVGDQVSSLRESLTSDAAAILLGGFNTGLQRAESSAWRQNRARGTAVIDELANTIDAKLNAVSLVKPAEGTYGLSSSNSPLVVTVENSLDRDVSVKVAITAGPGIVGFRSTAVTELIPANSRKTISIPTHVERLGQFKVTATLSTIGGQLLGQPIELRLRSTSLGGITKTITFVAATVLVGLLIRRFVGLIRNGRRIRPAGSTA